MMAPAFGHEARRPFPAHEHCFDCVELYAGCPAWPASSDFTCREYFPLPVAGIDGQTGQVFPPSRRRTPAHPAPDPIDQTTIPEPPAPVLPQIEPTDVAQGRTPSPAARYGPDGERLCECGVALRKRQRCCEACRQKRRDETMLRRRKPAAAPVGV